MKKIWRKLGTLCLILGLFFAMSMIGNAAADDIAGGVIYEEYGQITWRIDKNGHLTVEGWGDVSNEEGEKRIPWYAYRDKVLTAQIDVERMKNASYLFSGLTNVKSIDLKDFNTTGVKYMGGMFQNCSSLQVLDMSNFDTSSVTNMMWMFDGCRQLREVNVSNFDTKNVKYMDYMFAECESLLKIDVSNFCTERVISMGSMFRNCRKLTQLNLSNFDTGSVTDMGEMFYGCKSLEALDVSNFDTAEVDNMWGIFENCNRLKRLDLSGFQIHNSIYKGAILDDCWSLEYLESPKYLDKGVKIVLPKRYHNDVWYQSTGEEVTHVPSSNSESISLIRLDGKGFKDIDIKEWYSPYVEYVSVKGLMKGYDGFFTPNDSITRAMVVQTLYNMEGKPAVTDYKACKELKDVYQDWYMDAVCWAYNEGITTGYDDTKTFETDKSVTREELAAFLYRYANYKGYDTTQKGDSSGLQNVDKITPYAKNAMNWTVGAGLISGIEIKQDDAIVARDLAPQGAATRAQMAAILQRFCSAYDILLQNIQGNIPENAFEWNGHYYAVFDNCFNWEVAKAYCESRGGHLAVINSAEENEALYNFIKENGYTSAYFGLSDKAEEGNWQWVTGEDASYTNWNADEPGGGADENYAMFFYLYEDGTWNDGAFKENVHDGGNAYICEWE